MSNESGLGAAAAGESPRTRCSAPPEAAPRACASRLLEGLIHELKNPLAVVDGYAQLLHARLSEGDDARDDVAALLREARRIGGLLEDVLHWVRASPEEPRGALDARALLRSALALVAFELRRHSVRLEVTDDDPADLLADGRRGECLHALVTLFLALCAARATSLRVSVSAEQASSVRFAGTWCGDALVQDAPSAAAWDVARGAATRAGARLSVDRAGLTVTLEFPRAR